MDSNEIKCLSQECSWSASQACPHPKADTRVPRSSFSRGTRQPSSHCFGGQRAGAQQSCWRQCSQGCSGHCAREPASPRSFKLQCLNPNPALQFGSWLPTSTGPGPWEVTCKGLNTASNAQTWQLILSSFFSSNYKSTILMLHTGKRLVKLNLPIP